MDAAFGFEQRRRGEERERGEDVVDLGSVRVGGCEAVLEHSDGEARRGDQGGDESVLEVGLGFCERRARSTVLGRESLNSVPDRQAPPACGE